MQTWPKNVLLYSILACFVVLLLSNAEGDHYKLWDPNNKLTWKDFKDTLITDSHRAAATNSGIRLDFVQTDEHSLTINIYSVMFYNNSWVDSSRKSDYILSHEQYHFNISEYWSRKMKKDFASVRLTTKNIKEKVETIRRDDFAQCHEMQVEYDQDTKHSEIEAEQKKWEKKIDELLKSLEEYSATSITVKLR